MKKMKSLLLVLIAMSVLCGVSGTATAALSISYESTIAADGTLTTIADGAIVDNFDSGRPGWTYTGDYHIVNGPLPGFHAPPYAPPADATNYLAVPDFSTSTGSVTVDFGGCTYDYLGLFWGSMDAYNTVELLSGGSVVGTVTGTDASSIQMPGGGWTDPVDNAYVNIRGVEFDAVRLTSTQYAFELDNLAVVPVPGAFLLGMLGLSVAGVKLRKYA